MADEYTHEELSPGVHRVQMVEDDKLQAFHVLEGATGPVLIDTGFPGIPQRIHAPFLEENGWQLSDVSLAVITHSDADHFGGNHDLREHSPGVTLAAHVADADLMENRKRILSERYGQFEEDHDISYDQDVIDWLEGMMGPDEPVDLRLRGGEKLRVRDRQLTLLHTPGHSPGHLMLHDSEHGVVIGGDGFFGRGLTDVNGNYLQPPPYHLQPQYENSIQLVESLEPSSLSFAHYELLRGGAIDQFVQESLDFVREIESLALEIVDQRGSVNLREAIDAVVDRRGSFGLDLDLAYPLTAHYEDQTRKGNLVRTRENGVVHWSRP